MEHRGDSPGAPGPVREQAIVWLARLRSETTNRERADFERWYSADARHADTYDALLDSWDDTALVARTPIGERPPAAARRRGARVAAVAALLLLVAGSLAMNGFMRRDMAPDAVLASRVGEIRTIALEDGSRITLDTDSVVEVHYDRGERRVELQHGRARFEVAHDAQRPFIVTAGANEVVAHGTVFDVDLREPHVRVALLEGVVEVRQPATAKAPSKSTTLRPGQQLALGDARAVVEPVVIRVAETRWPSGMLSFEDVPLAEVVASANRYSRTQIVIGDRAVEERRFTGTFKAGEPTKLADIIGSMFDLSVQRNQDGNLVVAAAK